MSALRIISRSGQPFDSRQQAGKQLGRELAGLRGQAAVVLGIPRGGMVVAKELAGSLEAGLDIVLSRKLRAPGYPELALGAVAENGQPFLNQALVQELGVAKSYIEQETAFQLAEIKRRTALFRSTLAKVPLAGRLVIVTDDGVATGATMQAALWAVRQEKPDKLVAALPVAPEGAVNRLASDADEVICLLTPPYFDAVGQFYVRFEQIEDEEVLQILRQEQDRQRRK